MARRKTRAQIIAQYNRIKDALSRATTVDDYNTRKNGWNDMVGNEFEETFKRNRNGKAQFSNRKTAALKRFESSQIAQGERTRLNAMADAAYNKAAKAFSQG